MPENTTPSRRLDPRDPLVLDTRELGRRPGSMRPARITAPAPPGLGAGMSRVPERAPLSLDLRMEAVTEGVLVSGRVTAPVTGECGRCLDPVTDEITIDLQELYAYPNSTTDDTDPQGEVSRMVDRFIDLEPMVRDAVVLGLPLTPVCRQDCAGLCVTCGERLADLPADHRHEWTDPRWAALAERFGRSGADEDAGHDAGVDTTGPAPNTHDPHNTQDTRGLS